MGLTARTGRRVVLGSVGLALFTATLVGLPRAASAQSTVFQAADDSYVDASRATHNFGRRSFLRTDASPQRIAYLKFNVTGVGSPSSAALRIFANSGNSIGVDLRAVSNTTWSESTLTWNNRPAVGSVIGSSGPLQAGNWYLFDVSSLISGDGLVSFALTSQSTTASKLSSKEGANGAELLIPAPPSPSPFVVRRDGTTYHAESQTTSSSYSGTLKYVVESAVSELKFHGGGEVSFQAGNFDLGSDHFELDGVTDTTFMGQGIDATFLSNFTNQADDTEPFDFTDSKRTTIRGFTISAGGALRTTSDVIDFDRGDDNVVEDVKITSSRGRGIIFDGKDLIGTGTADRNVIRDCIIQDVPGDGIEFLASSENLVENCQIMGVGGVGIHVTKSSSSADQPNKKSNDNVISGNIVDQAGGDGIQVNSSDRNHITGNTVTNSADDTANRDGIRIQSNSSITCDANTIEFNTATDNQTPKTQRYGLNISSPECNDNVVGDNNFAGNLLGDINDNGTNTQFVSSDAEPPTAPANLVATSVTETQVDLAWDPSTDNVGVVLYRIFRDGEEIDTVNGATTTYTDTTVVPNMLYSYQVFAEDAAMNLSGGSNVLPVTTPADTAAPTPPGNLTATSVTHAAVSLAWDPSTDNVGVVLYRIFRDGEEIDTVNGATTTYTDTTVVPNMLYSYQVFAEDAAMNLSGGSNVLPVTTPAAPSTFTFTSVADSYVQQDRPTDNFGTRTSIRVDSSPERNVYVKFDVQGVTGTVTQATLRVFANSGSSVGIDARGVVDTTWGELTINYDNAPPFGASQAFSGPFSGGTWLEFDVTALVSGNGLVSFALTTPHTTAVSLASRESANPPELVIDVT